MLLTLIQQAQAQGVPAAPPVADPATAPSGCNPSLAGINLWDCFILNESGQTVRSVYDTPSVLINVIVNNLFLAAGIILFGILIFAGLKMAIQPTSKAKDEAKTIATSVVVGFLVMFCAYWIVQIIEIITGVKILNA